MLRTVTYNPGGQVMSELLIPYFRDKIKPVKPHIIALQEGRKWIDEAQEALPFMRLAIRNTEPVLYDHRHLAVLEAFTVPLSDEAFVGREGAGRASQPDKEMSVVLFRHRSNNRRVWVGNLHATPSIHVPQQPGSDVSRDELHEQQMEAATAFFRRKRLPGLLVGDFNAEWDHPNLRPVRDAGFRLGNPPGSTHGQRQIDLLTYKGAIRPAGKGKVIPGLNPKDHDAVVRTFRFV